MKEKLIKFVKSLNGKAFTALNAYDKTKPNLLK